MDDVPGETTSMRPVRIASTSHRVLVLAEDRSDVGVDGRAAVASDDRAVTIDQLRSAVTVRVPHGSDVVVGAESGRIEVRGPVGHVAATNESGRIQISDAASADIRQGTGRVGVRHCQGECRIHGSSGRIEVAGCGDADVSTRSGRIVLSDVAGDVRAHSVSGRIEVSLTDAHDVEAETVTGRIQVNYPDGVRPRVTGDAGSTTDDADCDCELSAYTISGRISVGRR